MHGLVDSLYDLLNVAVVVATDVRRLPGALEIRGVSVDRLTRDGAEPVSLENRKGPNLAAILGGLFGGIVFVLIWPLLAWLLMPAWAKAKDDSNSVFETPSGSYKMREDEKHSKAEDGFAKVHPFPSPGSTAWTSGSHKLHNSQSAPELAQSVTIPIPNTGCVEATLRPKYISHSTSLAAGGIEAKRAYDAAPIPWLGNVTTTSLSPTSKASDKSQRSIKSLSSPQNPGRATSSHFHKSEESPTTAGLNRAVSFLAVEPAGENNEDGMGNQSSSSPSMPKLGGSKSTSMPRNHADGASDVKPKSVFSMFSVKSTASMKGRRSDDDSDDSDLAPNAGLSMFSLNPAVRRSRGRHQADGAETPKSADEDDMDPEDLAAGLGDYTRMDTIGRDDVDVIPLSSMPGPSGGNDEETHAAGNEETRAAGNAEETPGKLRNQRLSLARKQSMKKMFSRKDEPGGGV